MGICAQTPKENTYDMSNVDITSPEFAPDVRSPLKLKETTSKTNRQNFKFVHSKHYERYFNRRFKVSMCCAKGERTTMEDAHLCEFELSNHPGYAVFGVFDGHHGSKASEYLSEHLYDALNNLQDIEDSDNIINVIDKMDKEFIASEYGQHGSTVLLAIIGSDFDSDLRMDTIRSERNKSVEKAFKRPSIESDKSHKKQFGNNRWLAGFEIKHNARVFWCGDSRGYLIKDFDIDSSAIPDFESLTSDHNTHNPTEVKRIENEGGKIINGRVDGKLGVTRSFGDSVMKYDGSVITSKCAFTQFSADIGDALLLCCDGLVEKWNDKRLIQKLQMNLNGRSQHKTDTDTAKGVGDLVDDAIYEGSDDNISAMFIQFKDGTKQETHKNYKDVGTINVN